MTIHRGECGHINLHWDNHLKCISCSHCSRESTCSTCNLWSDSIWDQKERRRTYASRKIAMSKKKKRSHTLSDSSVEEKNHGSTTPHGPAARGKTHKGGNSKGLCPLGSISPPGTGQPTTRQVATGQSSSGQEDVTNRPPTISGHRSLTTSHGSTATVQMGITHEISSQSMTGTGHRPSSLRSLNLENLNTGENIYSPVTGQSTNGRQSTDLISTYS